MYDKRMSTFLEANDVELMLLQVRFNQTQTLYDYPIIGAEME